MRIVIDLQGAQSESRFRGIGRYSLSIAKEIAKNRGKHEVIIVISSLFPDTIEDIKKAFEDILPRDNIRIFYAIEKPNKTAHEYKQVIQANEVIREAFLESLNPDIIFITSLFEGYSDNAITSIKKFDKKTKIAVISYDLIPFIYQDIYFLDNQDYKEYYLEKIEHLKKADIFLSISESSSNELKKYLQIDSSKIYNILGAVDETFVIKNISNRKKEEFLKKFNIKKPFILYAGGFDERKNLPRLIEAFSKLPQNTISNYQLVIAGKIGNEYILNLETIAQNNNLEKESLLFTNYISDEDLIYLYNLTSLYVFPSWHEGFGLPALEAMSCGAVVIGSNTSSIPEVIGCKDALFDPSSVESISHKIQEVLSDIKLQNSLKKHNSEQINLFSWNNTAQKAINIFEKYEKEFEYNKDTKELQYLLTGLTPFISELSESKLVELSHCISLNYPKISEKKQIFVDISELITKDAKTGIQRVVRSILKQWLENPPEDYDIRAVYSSSDIFGYKYATKFTANFLKMPIPQEEDEYIEYSKNDIFFALDYQAHVQMAQKDFFKHLKEYGVKVVFCIYDLLSISHAKYFPKGTDEVFTRFLELVFEVDKVICISESVSKELSSYKALHYQNKNKKFEIDWFHLGADIENSNPTGGFLPDSENILEVIASKPTFLMVGTVEPRKGHKQVLDAFNLLWQENNDLNLVIVGKNGWMVDDLVEELKTHKELNTRLFWLEGISDEYLEEVYKKSTTLIAASYGEGFGLPLIEAAQRSLPILARDIPVFREVAKEFATYFRGNHPRDIALSIKEFIENYKQNRYPKSENIPWLTWEKSARSLIDKIIKD